MGDVLLMLKSEVVKDLTLTDIKSEKTSKPAAVLMQ